MIKKCYFCEHDRGPFANQMNACLTCRDFDNFQIKRRMSPREMYEFNQYIREELSAIRKYLDRKG